MSQCPATVDVEGETVRCWREAGHEGSHMGTDGERWIATETPASAPESDATGLEVQRQPGNLADDYSPFNTYTRTVAYMGDLHAGKPTAEAELAALKARRCDGCAHWFPIDFGANACEQFMGLRPPADHACNDWTPKP